MSRQFYANEVDLDSDWLAISGRSRRRNRAIKLERPIKLPEEYQRAVYEHYQRVVEKIKKKEKNKQKEEKKISELYGEGQKG